MSSAAGGRQWCRSRERHSLLEQPITSSLCDWERYCEGRSRTRRSRAVEEQHEFGFATRAIHAGQRPDPETGARAMPIYATTSFVFEDAQHAADLFALQNFGNIYTRIGNPTNAAFEERMAILEGGLGAVATGVGQAAQLIADPDALARRATRSWRSQPLRRDLYPVRRHVAAGWASTSTFVDPATPTRSQPRSAERTKLLYGETIGNPRGDVLDIEAFADVATRTASR